MGELARYMAQPSQLEVRRHQRRVSKEILRVGEATEKAIAVADGEFDLVRAKIGNAADLTQYAITRLVPIHNTISAVSHERPALEMQLRILQEGLAFGSAQVINDYLLRR